MRALEVIRLGKTTAWVPSLGTLVARTNGKEIPPLVESSRLTLVALTGEAVVPATFQVTVRTPDQVTAELGEVMTKGPALLATVTCISALFTPPPPARLSRATTRNLSRRLVVGSISPRVVVWLSRSESWGKIREGLVEGRKDRKIGLAPLSGLERAVAEPRSRSSQQKVSRSPSESLPAAVNWKGVPFGIMKLGPALTAGAVFPAGVAIPQIDPFPAVM